MQAYAFIILFYVYELTIHLVCTSCKRKLEHLVVLRCMSLPDSTPQQHIAASPGIKLSQMYPSQLAF
jgi:hypothetical protein